ncbi:MAG TPA: kelch repeat-containing protein, partial [Acidimicrobiales bacterium]|nr:kelch repeat-containing protein [Acidimicrobiales bacterium]
MVAVLVGLVVAGSSSGQSLPGAWRPTTPMGTPRFTAPAVVLENGKVLVVGGTQDGGASELYDPDTATWSATGPMVTAPRYDHTATLLTGAGCANRCGKVLVAGGTSGSGAFDSAELYDPATNTWSATGSMSTARIQFTATQLADGRVLAAGGDGPGGNQAVEASAELYDPATGTWSPTGSMVAPAARSPRAGRSAHTA